ncbi:hypothetical protein Bca101_059913 [Brassica carinata]
MAVKTDMSKAYDRLEWDFIRLVFERLGFDAIWTEWIMSCISSVSYSYLLDDSAHGHVVPSRGIRQGDPLSPYIFILCGEVLSGLCRQAQASGHMTGLRVATTSLRINHLLFADDTMFFLKTDVESCATLSNILRKYETASGQLINTAKSSISFSSQTPQETRLRVHSYLGIEKEGGVGKYLGLPEHFGRRKKDLFTSIVERIRQRANSWSTRRLSQAGKLVMLKSVLSAIPTYAMTCFQLPVSLCKRIQSVLTRFWWDSCEEKKGMCCVSWDRITKPKDLGGLGIRDIQHFNTSLLAKQAWRIVTKPEGLFARVLVGKSCRNSSFLTVKLPKECSHGGEVLWQGGIY